MAMNQLHYYVKCFLSGRQDPLVFEVDEDTSERVRGCLDGTPSDFCRFSTVDGREIAMSLRHVDLVHFLWDAGHTGLRAIEHEPVLLYFDGRDEPFCCDPEDPEEVHDLFFFLDAGGLEDDPFLALTDEDGERVVLDARKLVLAEGSAAVVAEGFAACMAEVSETADASKDEDVVPDNAKGSRPRSVSTETKRVRAGDASDSLACGVDGCSNGWVVVWHDLGKDEVSWEVLAHLTDILAAARQPDVIGVDVPVGLLEAGARECDVEARRRLGFPRSASVFPAPIRPVLAASSQAEASAIRKTVESKGMSVQAWGIVPKVRETDEALRASPALRALTREVHPELCFAGMNEGGPMAYSKKKAEGRAERVSLLRAHFGDVIDEALASKPKGCKYDDLLDAFACAWTAARVALGEEDVIPANPPRDGFELPMEMVI